MSWWNNLDVESGCCLSENCSKNLILAHLGGGGSSWAVLSVHLDCLAGRRPRIQIPSSAFFFCQVTSWNFYTRHPSLVVQGKELPHSLEKRLRVSCPCHCRCIKNCEKIVLNKQIFSNYILCLIDHLARWNLGPCKELDRAYF